MNYVKLNQYSFAFFFQNFYYLCYLFENNRNQQLLI